MNKVIVTGGNHHNTYGVIRALADKKIKPFLLLVNEDSNSFLLKSILLEDSYVVKTEQDAISFLIKNCYEFNGAVVIACSDGMSSALDSSRNVLDDFYKLPGTKEQGRVTTLMDKETMSQLGVEVGFNVPKSWLIRSVNDIDCVEYPCITKPILSKDGHKDDISICHCRKDLEKVIKEGSCYEYQVQRFITKDFEYQLIGLSLNEGEIVIIPGFSRCIRPCPRTNTGFLHYESLNRISAPIEKCKSFVRKTEYSGLFSIEFLRDNKGVDYFMEMNFRNDGNAICVTSSGTNLPYIWYLANSTLGYKEELSHSTFHSVYVMPEFPDFESFVYTGKISIIKWIKDIIRTDTFMVCNRKDIKPFIFCLKRLLKRFYRKFLVRTN